MQSVLLTPAANRFVNSSTRAASPAATASLPATRDTVTLRFGAVGEAHPHTPGLVKNQDGYYTGTITHNGKQYKIEPRAELYRAELPEALLAGADLFNAELPRANLRKANLSDAILNKADLWYAELPGANLRKANLSDAILAGANLTSAQNIPGSILDSSITRILPAFYDISQPLPTLEKGLTFAQLANRRIVPAHDAGHAMDVYTAFDQLLNKHSLPEAFKALADVNLNWTDEEKATLRQMAEASQPKGLFGRLFGGS